MSLAEKMGILGGDARLSGEFIREKSSALDSLLALLPSASSEPLCGRQRIDRSFFSPRPRFIHLDINLLNPKNREVRQRRPSVIRSLRKRSENDVGQNALRCGPSGKGGISSESGDSLPEEPRCPTGECPIAII